MILAGLGGIVIVEIYAAVMQREFQNTDNQVGKGFAILGIYLFVVTYCELFPIVSQETVLILTVKTDGMLNSTTWLYGAEVLPIALRSKVMGLAAASHFIVNVGITEAGPSAFSHVSNSMVLLHQIICSSLRL